MAKNILKIVIILVFITLIAGGIWSWQTKTDLKTYKNSEFGFEFSYPKNLTLYETGTETRRPTPQLDEFYLSYFLKNQGQLWVSRLNIRESNLDNINNLKYNYQEWMPGDKVTILNRTNNIISGKNSIIETLYNKYSPATPITWVHILNNNKIYSWLFIVTTSTPEAAIELKQTEDKIISSFKFTN